MSERRPDLPAEEDPMVLKALKQQANEDLVKGREFLIEELQATHERHEVERRSWERTLETDRLTGVANDRAMEKALPAAEADPLTLVCVFDANNFKGVNDELGHEQGDEVLKELAQAIKQAAEGFGLQERVFRYGKGDEFVVLAPADVAHQVVAAAEDMFGIRHYGQQVISVSGTVGATFNEADSVLQSAKDARKSDPEHPIRDRELTSDPDHYQN